MRSELLNLLPRCQLSDDLQQLHADLDYLGILREYGSCCLFINSLVILSLRRKAYQVELRCCYATLRQNTHLFYLGHHDFVSPGQLAGHVICEMKSNSQSPSNYLIDFGLGNLRKMVTHTPQAAVMAFCERADNICNIELRSGEALSWTGINTIDGLDDAIKHQQAKLMKVFARLENFQKNRLKHCLHRALHKNMKQTTNKALCTESRQIFQVKSPAKHSFSMGSCSGVHTQ